jgi:hypothetical protein
MDTRTRALQPAEPAPTIYSLRSKSLGFLKRTADFFSSTRNLLRSACAPKKHGARSHSPREGERPRSSCLAAVVVVVAPVAATRA